jgi:ATP adenylyltransferase
MERLWAPWRLQYVNDTFPKKPGCFFCNAWEDRGNEKEHLLLARGEKAFVMMNRFPYNNGHLMVAPVRHVGDMEEVTSAEAAEIWMLAAACKKIMAESMKAEGCNIGINQGKCAGAGVLDHIHVHVVPRWNGDTNFMPVMADARVVPQALQDCFDNLRPHLAARGW